MAVVREQFAFESALVASVADTATQTYTLTRPFTTPVEGNNLDHVARPRVRLEFNQGKVSVFGNAAVIAANIALRKIEILDASGNVLRTPLSVTDNGFDTSLTVTQDLLKSFILKEDEYSIKLTIVNHTGGAITNTQFSARADFGLNAANYGVTLP